MNKIEVFPFEIAGRVETVFLHVALYSLGMRLAVEMYCIGKAGVEPYAKITANLPSAPFQLNHNEAFIDVGIAGKEFLTFIGENHLGAVVPYKTYKGYPVVAFDWERLRECDAQGVEKVEAVRRKFGL